MAQGTTKSSLPEHVLRAIRGELTEEEKKAQLDQSLSSWWKEYAARKNDEDQEHVADSLLYDERCHLPRTAPPPTLSDGSTPAGPSRAGPTTATGATATATAAAAGTAAANGPKKD